MTRNKNVKLLTAHTHGSVLVILCVIRLIHVPCAADIRQLDLKVGALLYVAFIEFGVNP